MTKRSPLWLRFLWTPERQEIAVDGEAFAHPEATGTSPSHDVAHLLAAAGGIAWKPRGTRNEICLAELNAVLLEHLGVNTLEAVLLGRGHAGAALDRAIEHARWFATEHYAPFPESFDSALARFREGLDVEVIVRLSPVFFRMRAFELEHADFRERVFSAQFCSTLRPRVAPGWRELQQEFASQLGALVTS